MKVNKVISVMKVNKGISVIKKLRYSFGKKSITGGVL